MSRLPSASEEKVDVLCIGAHQDDIDATVGGTIIRLVGEGYRVEVVDLTKRRGMYFAEEEEWGNEAENAARAMGITRTVLDLSPQNHLANTHENRVAVADVIRQKRPDVIITNSADRTHPDHWVAHQLVQDANHYAFATAIKTAHAPWRPKKIYYAPTSMLFEGAPGEAFLVDVSDAHARKMEALKSYASQLLFHSHNRKYELEYIEAQSRAWGLQIRREYAEMLLAKQPVLEPFPELRKVA